MRRICSLVPASSEETARWLRRRPTVWDPSGTEGFKFGISRGLGWVFLKAVSVEFLAAVKYDYKGT